MFGTMLEVVGGIYACADGPGARALEIQTRHITGDEYVMTHYSYGVGR